MFNKNFNNEHSDIIDDMSFITFSYPSISTEVIWFKNVLVPSYYIATLSYLEIIKNAKKGYTLIQQ